MSRDIAYSAFCSTLPQPLKEHHEMTNPIRGYILSALSHLRDTHDIEGLAQLVADAATNPVGAKRYATRVRVFGWSQYNSDKDEIHCINVQMNGDSTFCYSTREQAQLFLEAAIAEYLNDQIFEENEFAVNTISRFGNGDIWFTFEYEGEKYEGRASVIKCPLVFARELA